MNGGQHAGRRTGRWCCASSWLDGWRPGHGQAGRDRRRGPCCRADGERARATCSPAKATRPFLRMSSNGYLGLALHPAVIAAEEAAARSLRQRAGRGAVHQRHLRAARRSWSAGWPTSTAARRRMIFCSAYAAMMGVLPPLVTPRHGRGQRRAEPQLHHQRDRGSPGRGEGRLHAPRPGASLTVRSSALTASCAAGARRDRRRLQHARRPCAARRISAVLRAQYDQRFAENAVLVVDDSHGVGAFGATRPRHRGGDGSRRADVLVATLGKALRRERRLRRRQPTLIDHLRETSPIYIYSNPITPAEAAGGWPRRRCSTASRHRVAAPACAP